MTPAAPLKKWSTAARAAPARTDRPPAPASGKAALFPDSAAKIKGFVGAVQRATGGQLNT
jgi:hypothetical protein